MTRKRWQKLVRAYITKKWVEEGRLYLQEPLGKSYKRIRNTKVDWDDYRDAFSDITGTELVDFMMYACSLYARDYGTQYDLFYKL